MSKYRNSFIIFISLTIINFFVCYGLYNQGSKYYKKLIDEKLLTSINLYEMLIDTNDLNSLISNPNVDNNDLYKKTIDKLQRAYDKSINIKFLYTLHKIENSYHFGIDTAYRVDSNKDGVNDHSDLNSVYSQVPKEALDSYYTEQTIISKQPYTDQWGTFIGVFKPLYKDNKIISLLCVEMDYTVYHQKLIDFKNYLICLFVLLFISTIILIYYVYISQQQQIIDVQRLMDIEGKDKIISAEAKMADIGRMMAGINHEINNPLQIIKGFSDMGKKMINREYSKEEMKKVFDKIDIAVKRVTDIIKFMKSLVQNENDNNFELIDIKNIIDEVKVFTAFKIKEFEIDLKEGDFSNIFIKCKKVSIQQILINLLGNSIDSIKDNNEKWIKILYDEDNDFHYITVIDSGKGILSHELERINEGQYSTKKDGQGSGLGLILSKKIAIIHHGSIEYIGQKNTAFRLSISKHL